MIDCEKTVFCRKKLFCTRLNDPKYKNSVSFETECGAANET